MTDWNLQTMPTSLTKWDRSWRQEFFTDLGSDFTLVAHIEEVKTLDDGTVTHTLKPPVVRKLSEVGSDPRVQQLHALMTELIKEWMDQDAR